MDTAKAIRSMWIGKLSLYNYQDVTDPITHQTTHKLACICENEPCRVSYQREFTKPSYIEGGVGTADQRITLITRPDLCIEAGSVIEVTQRGVTVKYKRASAPMIYTHHQEVWLELFEDYV